MRILVRAMSQRSDCIAYLKERLPTYAEYLIDTPGNAMGGFLHALATAGDDPCVHMEEDIYLIDRFEEKLLAAIGGRPDEVIQFFSMRKADIEIGSRHEPGRTFLMNQCFYLPAGYSRMIQEYYPRWPRKEEHPTGSDLLIADWLKERREKYWIHVPSLVQHRPGRSLINPRRPQWRQSQTFVEVAE